MNISTFPETFSLCCTAPPYSSIELSVCVLRARWPLGAPGRPGGLAGHLARCTVFYIIYLFIYLLPSQCAKVIISDYGIPLINW